MVIPRENLGGLYDGDVVTDIECTTLEVYAFELAPGDRIAGGTRRIATVSRTPTGWVRTICDDGWGDIFSYCDFVTIVRDI